MIVETDAGEFDVAFSVENNINILTFQGKSIDMGDLGRVNFTVKCPFLITPDGLQNVGWQRVTDIDSGNPTNDWAINHTLLQDSASIAFNQIKGNPVCFLILMEEKTQKTMDEARGKLTQVRYITVQYEQNITECGQLLDNIGKMKKNLMDDLGNRLYERADNFFKEWMGNWNQRRTPWLLNTRKHPTTSSNGKQPS